MINNNTKYAGFWIRFAAFIIDYALINLVLLPLHFMDLLLEPVLLFYSFLFSFVFYWLYYAVLHSSKWQATLGKFITGIIVVDSKGQRITFARATGRYFAEFLSAIFLFIGYMMAGWNPRKQALHDTLAETFVIYGKPEELENKTLKIPPIEEQKTIKVISTFNMPFSLKVLNGINQGSVIPLTGIEKKGYYSVTAGRDKSFNHGHIEIEDPDFYISSMHVEFACKKGTCYIRNMSKTNPASQNGTTLPDTKTFYPVTVGDVITLGATDLQLIDP